MIEKQEKSDIPGLPDDYAAWLPLLATAASVQIACIQSLALFGVSHETAVAYSLLVHAAFFFPITFVGIGCLLGSRFSFAEIGRGGEIVDANGPDTSVKAASNTQGAVA